MASNDEHILSIVVRLRDAASKGLGELDSQIQKLNNHVEQQADSYRKSIKASSDRRRELNKEIQELERSTKKLERFHRFQGEGFEQEKKQYEENIKRLRELTREREKHAKASETALGKLQRAYRNAEKAIQNAQKIYEKHTKATVEDNKETDRSVQTKRRHIDAIKEETREIDRQIALKQKMIDTQVGVRGEDDARIVTLRQEIEQLKERRRIVNGDITVRERLANVTNRLRSRYNSLRESSDKLWLSQKEWNEVVAESRRSGDSLWHTAGRLENRFERFGGRIRSVGNDIGALERRFALLGRAMLGLMIASIIVFLQSFLSIITAVVAQAVALASSLTYAAGVLGGTFAAALTQVIPLVGLLAAAMQRLSLIGDAINEQDKIRQQQAGKKEQQLKSEASANDAVADAQRAVLKAQEELTEARAEARRELQDLILAEREAELAAKRASLAYRDSRAALRDAVQSGDIGGLQNTELDVAEARLGRRRSQINLSRTRQDAGAARRGGVEGMERVRDASERLADAQRNLARAQRQAAESAATQSAAQEKLAFIMSELSPIERRLVRQLTRFRDRLEETFRPITDILLESFSRGIERAERVIFNNRIVEGFRDLSRETAAQVDRVSKVFTDNRAIEFWRNMLRESRRNLEPITDIFINLGRVWMNITEAAAPAFRRLLRDIVNLTREWAEDTENQERLERFFNQGLRHLRAWGRLIRAIIGLWAELMGVSGDSAIKTIDDLTERLKEARENIRENKEAVKAFFDETSVGFGYIIDILVRLGEMFLNTFDAETIENFSQIIDNILIPAFEHSIGMMGNAIEILTEFLTLPVVSEITKWALAIGLVHGQLSLLFRMLSVIVKPIWAVILLIAGGGVKTMIGSFRVWAALIAGEVMSSLRKFIALIRGRLLTALRVTLATTGIGAVLVAIGLLIEHWDKIGPALEDALNFCLEILDDVTQPFEDAANFLGGILSSVWDTMKDSAIDAFDTILGAFTSMMGYIADVLSVSPDIPLIPDPQDAADKLNEVIKDVDEWREEIRGGKKEVHEYTGALRANTNAISEFDAKTERASRKQKRLGEETKKTADKQDEQRRGTRKLNRGLNILAETLLNSSQTSRSLGEMLGTVTNNVLAAFGAKELKFVLPSVAKITSIIGRSLGFGGLFDAIEGGQTGGFFGHPNERGPDDRLIAVAGGEAILTGHQQQAANMAFAFANAAGVVPYASLSDLFANDRRPHATAPRGYQKGGIVPVPGFPGERINSKVLDTFLQLSKRFKLFLTDAYGPGHKSIEHTRLGTAIDVVPHPGMGGTWADVNRAVAYSVRRGFTPVYYDGSGGSINLPPHGPGHHAHITLLTASEYGSGMSPGSVGGGFGFRIPRIKVRGPEGPLRDMLQGQSDKLRKAANRRIMEELSAMGHHGPVNVPGNLYGVNELARLWRSVNGDFGDARLMAAIAMAESSGNPAANGPPDGRGLWQIEWPIWGSTLGHLGNPYNPKANARMAGEILRRQGLSAWVVYNTGAYRQFMQRGGFVPQFDKGGVVPGPTGSPQLIMAHGGETILPTHKYQTGGKVRNNLRSVNRQLNRISKTGVDSIDRLTNLLTALLRDGGLLDDLSTTLEQFVAAQSRRLNEWAYRVRRGGVAQIRSNTRIAEKQLDQLEEVGKFLNKEVDQIERAIRITRRKIQNADTAKERRRLRTALNNLIDRHGQISDALNQNLIERLNAQRAVFESIMARFDARLGINDLRQRILQAQGEISGDLDEEAMEKLLNRRGDILRDQRQEIRRELRRARRRGDRERALELEQALLENELALLENTKALQDLEDSIKETFDFNSTAWQQFRFAIFDGMGGLLPQFQIPQISTNGIITNVPQTGAGSGNPVIPTTNNGDTNVYITEPMEVADPVALSNAIAFKLKTDKT